MWCFVPAAESCGQFYKFSVHVIQLAAGMVNKSLENAPWPVSWSISHAHAHVMCPEVDAYSVKPVRKLTRALFWMSLRSTSV